MVLGINYRRKIIYLRLTKKWTYRKIREHLQEVDNCIVPESTARGWITTQKEKGNYHVYSNRRPRKSRGVKVQPVHLTFLDEKIAENPERGSVELQKLLQEEFGLTVSPGYIRKLRVKLGWVSKRTKYGQMIRDINKEKRLKWAQEQIANGENFDDVIFSDEASFEAKRTTGRTYYRKGEKIIPRPKSKHPVKVRSSADFH